MKFITAAFIGVLACASAVAQTADEDDEARMGAIVVQGTKFERSLQDVPDSVAVITGEEIAREPVADLYDIVERIPNVTSAFGEQGFAIRGVDQRGIGGGGSGLTITTYVDDAPLGNQTTFFGPTGAWDVEQIEVFRGPQSTNFGRNALAGAICIRTRDPSFEPDLRIRGEIAEADTFQISAAGGTSIIDDLLAFRLSGDYRESDGFIRNTFLDEQADATELSNLRGKLLFTPTSDLKFVTTTTYAENFAGEDLVPIDLDDDFVDEVQYDTAGREGTETFLQALNATWDVTDTWQIQSITTYQTTDYVRVEDFDVTPAPIAALDRTGDDEAFSQELRIKYSGERLKAVVGFYYVDIEDGFVDSFSIPATAVNAALPPTIIIVRDSSTTSGAQNLAFFGDGEFQLTDTISLLFGARFDNEEADTRAFSSTSVLGEIPPQFAFRTALLGDEESETDAEFDAFLPKGGVQWAVTDTTNIAFIVSRGYRAGGSELSVLDGSVIDFDPEFITNLELSTRSSLLDDTLVVNTNLFYADWEDQQVPVPISPDAPELVRTVNAGESSLMGFELEVDYQVTDTLDVYGSLGYVESEFEDFVVVDPATGIEDDLAGNRFPFAAEWSANVGFAQFHEFGLFYGADLNFRDEVFSTNENEPFNVVPSRTLVNARLGYEFLENYILTLYARNLFDDDNIQTLNRDPVLLPTGEVVGSPAGTARFGNPQQFGIRLDANF